MKEKYKPFTYFNIFLYMAGAIIIIVVIPYIIGKYLGEMFYLLTKLK